MKGKSISEYRNEITLTTFAIVLVFLDVYLSLLADAELLAKLLAFITVDWLKDVVLWLAQFVIMGSFSAAVYKSVEWVVALRWRLSHREIWYDGVWLHIHEKGNVRIGFVDIKQNFYELDITGENYDIEQNTGVGGGTTWHYIGSEFPADENGNALVSCYTALRKGQIKKYGLHMLEKKKSTADGMPEILKGTFGDALKIEDAKGITVSDRTGGLYLYRITKENRRVFEKYLKDRSRIPEIQEDPEAAETAFVRDLVEVVRRSKFSNQLGKVREELKNLNKQPITGISEADVEEMLKRIMYRVVLCDRKRALGELQYINRCLGTHWTLEEVHNIFDSIESNEDFDASLTAFLDGLRQYETLYNKFKTLVRVACSGLAEADGITKEDEELFAGRVNNFFNHTGILS